MVLLPKHMSKVILLTGGSKGIGRVTAKYLHEQGYTVYGTSRQPTDEFDYPLLQLDVTDDESVQSCVEEIIQHESRIDVLINNAGFGMAGPLAEASIDDIQWQFDTNVFGVHRMVRAVLPQMRSQESAMIINIGSFGGRLAVPYQALYSASKAAVAMYSDGLRMELMRDNIVVTCIEPGDTSSDFDTGRVGVSGYDDDEEIAERALKIMREAEHNGTDPKKIAKTIGKIINRGKAKPRYTTGWDATILGVVQRFLPFSLQERAIMMNYKVPRKE